LKGTPRKQPAWSRCYSLAPNMEAVPSSDSAELLPDYTASHSSNLDSHSCENLKSSHIVLFLPGNTSFSSGLFRIQPFLCWMMHWNIFQSCELKLCYVLLLLLCDGKGSHFRSFTTSIHTALAAPITRDRCWKATTRQTDSSGVAHPAASASPVSLAKPRPWTLG
jgi:hypothetical protein